MSEIDPYYYAREHDGSGWSVRGPNGFVIKKADGPLDKNFAYCIAKLLSGKPNDALMLLRDVAAYWDRHQELEAQRIKPEC